MTAIDVPCVLFRISKLWSEGMDEDDLYDVTHGWWVMGPNRERAEYALAVAKGRVRGAYRVFGWRERRYDDAALVKTSKPRWGFDGEPASELAHLIGLDVRELFPKGSANPVRYLNLDAKPLPAAYVDDDGKTPKPTLERLDERLGFIRQAVRSLKENPLLDLSLGSKELFHSNFLGWLFEQHESIAREVLAPWSEKQPTKVHRIQREKHHLDLIIEIPGAKAIVVENKAFSLPDESQLDGYAAKNIITAGFTDATKILLSITDPGWPDGTYEGWTWVSYVELAQRVREAALGRLEPGSFELQLVRGWCDLAVALAQIARSVVPSDGSEPLVLDGDSLAALKENRLDDAFQKFRNFGARSLLQARSAQAGLVCDDFEAGFANSMPLLSARLHLPDGAELGWQLQGNQWRRFVIAPIALQGRTEQSKKARIQYARAVHGGWFDFPQEQALGPFMTAPTKDLKHFAPGFVYEYIKVPGITVGRLLDLNEVTLRAAHAHRRSLKARS